MKCWSCGSDLAGGLRHFFTCPLCSQVEELKGVQDALDKGFSEVIEVLDEGFEELSAQLANIASILEWGFEEVNWRLDQIKGILGSIDKTLKTPSQTQANEWRQIAEELRGREVLDESERFFLESLETNPLDYRTYIGLGKTYLQLGDGGKARLYWEKSLPHAPKKEIDYKSYSYRLIGHLDFCEGNSQKAATILKKAVDLSPNYWFAHYDYAQYSALSGDEKNCFSSLVVLMAKEPTLLKLAEREKNFEKLKKEIQTLLQPIRCMEEAEQEVKRATEFLNIGREKYCDVPMFLFLLKDFNPFDRFLDKLIKSERAMNKNYWLAQQAVFKDPLNEILANNSSVTDYLEKVCSLTLQTTELAHQIIDLVGRQYPRDVKKQLVGEIVNLMNKIVFKKEFLKNRKGFKNY